MAKTYGELILECQNFQYSKENYELSKDCHELELMTQYVENHYFMVENVEEIRSQFQEFDESFFMEAEEISGIDVVLEAAEKKSKNIFKRIGRGLKNLWKKIKGFFARLFGKSKKTSKKNEELIKELENMSAELVKIILDGTTVTVTTVETPKEGEGDTKPEDAKADDNKPDEGKADDKKDNKPEAKPEEKKSAPKGKITPLGDILVGAWKPEYVNEGYNIAPNQPNAKKTGVNKMLKDKRQRALLAAAFSNTVVQITVTSGKKIVAVKDITEIFKKLSEVQDNLTEADAKTLRDMIKNSMAKVKTVAVEVNPETQDAILKELDEIDKKMQSYMGESAETDIDLDMFMEKKGGHGSKDPIKKARQDKQFTQTYHSFKDLADAYNENPDKVMGAVTKTVVDIKDVYQDLMVMAGNMMKLYNYVELFRAEVGNAVGGSIEAAKKYMTA